MVTRLLGSRPLKMQCAAACLLLPTLLVALVQAQGKRLTDCVPPSIVEGPEKEIYFIKDGKLELPCIARGTATLVYSWLKNGEKMDLETEEAKKRMSLRTASGAGTLIIFPAKEGDDGVYQCKVQNTCGTSLSNFSHVQQADLNPFKAVIQPEVVSGGLGQPLKLMCNSPASIPEAAITWIIWDEMKNKMSTKQRPYTGSPIVLTERITLDYDGNLYITNLKKEDEQKGSRYLCVANNAEVRSWMQGEDKTITTLGNEPTKLPVELLWNSDVDVLGLVGNVVSFKCIFGGNPQPTIRWERIGGKKDPSRMIQSDDFFELNIIDVDYADAGEYECIGSNGLLNNREIKMRFSLKVESGPIWQNEPRDLDVGVEGDAVFPCRASGRPEPQVEWFINGNPISVDSSTTRMEVQTDQIIFRNISESDAKVIQCNVSNIHGYLWGDVYLHPLAIPAEVVKPPQDMLKVANGHEATITCEATGEPKPIITWFKGSQPVQVGRKRYEVLPSGNLVIKDVRTKDDGEYRCEVKNKFGRDEGKGSLVVRERTVISRPPISVQLIHGNEVMLNCQAQTDPAERARLRYEFFKGEEPVDTSDPRVQQDEGRLRILDTQSKDSGNYTCKASNGLDSAMAWATVEVKAPPDPPTNVKVTECQSRRASVGWTFLDEQSNFAAMENFILEYSTSYNPDEWIVGVRPGPNRRNISIDLSPFGNYTFRVKGVNTIGVGRPSKPSPTVCFTPQARPDHHPHNVRTVGDKTNYIVVEWEPMPQIEHNGPGFHYIVTVKPLDGNGTVVTQVIDDWMKGSKAIKVDTVYKPYSVTVQAKNQMGFPLDSAANITGYSGEAAPLVTPENFELDPDVEVSATSAGFMWDPVSDDPEVIRGKFRGYMIRFWKKDQKNDTLHEVFIPPKKSMGGRRYRRQAADQKVRALVPNLYSYAEIESDVVAVNSHFFSNGSNIINFSTPEGVPSAVQYVVVQLRGSNHFYLEWGEPEEKNGELLGYNLGYQRIDGLDFGTIVESDQIDDPLKRRAFMGGLEPDTWYRVYVWGRTSKGKGKPYYVDVQTTEEDPVLVSPTILHVAPGFNTGNVSWKMPENYKGARVGSHYYLEYREKDKDEWERTREQQTDQFWMVLRGLQPATDYEVRVIAHTDSDNDSIFGISDTHEFSTGGVGAKKSSFLSAGWFIGMMVAIAILLLILIIVCIVKRNRGDKYHVQEKERLRGSNPDDNQDHFNEYAKSDENGIGQSGSFSNDPEKMPLEDETDSMEEYGDVDPCKFNEDGSFIGQYGAQKSGGSESGANQSAMSTLV